MNHILHPEADVEFLDAVRHYAGISHDLGDRFFDEISALLRAAIEPRHFTADYADGADNRRYSAFIRDISAIRG